MSYKHLTINERCCIYQFKNSDIEVRTIAKALHRSPSTISREINRNIVESGGRRRFYRYYPNKAQDLYELRRKKYVTVKQSMILMY